MRFRWNSPSPSSTTPASATVDVVPVDEDAMVREFLRAELASPRFADRYQRALAAQGWDASRLFANAPDASRQRRTLLGIVRGFDSDRLLFRGFPQTVTWTRQRLTASALDRLHYGNFPEWVALSRGTRRVRDAAPHVSAGGVGADLSAHITGVLATLRQGAPIPALIALATTPQRWVLLEGHTRATALTLMNEVPAVPLLLGHARDFSGWAYV